MARVPGLGMSKVNVIHKELGVENLEQLEEAARAINRRRVPCDDVARMGEPALGNLAPEPG